LGNLTTRITPLGDIGPFTKFWGFWEPLKLREGRILGPLPFGPQVTVGPQVKNWGWDPLCPYLDKDLGSD